jgi:hypothetical protein
MLERLAFQMSQGPQAILVRALAILSCGALLFGLV